MKPAWAVRRRNYLKSKLYRVRKSIQGPCLEFTKERLHRRPKFFKRSLALNPDIRPFQSFLRHIGDAPVHWHEETSSCGGILLSEENARQYQYWQANPTFQWFPDKWYPAVFPEAKGCADDLHRTILASFHGDSFELRSCLFRSDASANDISNRCLQKSTLPVLLR